VILSNGSAVIVVIKFVNRGYDEKQLSQVFADKLIKNTQLLYCRYISTCFNPFEETL
jgi:hypothetical protein